MKDITAIGNLVRTNRCVNRKCYANVESHYNIKYKSEMDIWSTVVDKKEQQVVKEVIKLF